MLEGKFWKFERKKGFFIRRYEEDGVQDQAVAREVLLLRGVQKPDRD